MSKWLWDSWGGLITNQWYFQECWVFIVQSKRNRIYSMGHFTVTGQWDHHHLSSDARILPSGGPHGNGWIFWHQGVLALLSCIACMWGPNLFFFLFLPFSPHKERCRLICYPLTCQTRYDGTVFRNVPFYTLVPPLAYWTRLGSASTTTTWVVTSCVWRMKMLAMAIANVQSNV